MKPAHAILATPLIAVLAAFALRSLRWDPYLCIECVGGFVWGVSALWILRDTGPRAVRR